MWKNTWATRMRRQKVLQLSKPLENVRRPNDRSKLCQGFCSEYGAYLGMFNFFGKSLGHASHAGKFFQCDDNALTVDDGQCIDGYSDPKLRCCKSTCKPEQDLPSIGVGSFGDVYEAIADQPSDSWLKPPAAVRVALKGSRDKYRMICIPSDQTEIKKETPKTLDENYKEYEECANEYLVEAARDSEDSNFILKHVTPYYKPTTYQGRKYLSFKYMDDGDFFDMINLAYQCEQSKSYKKKMYKKFSRGVQLRSRVCIRMDASDRRRH